MIMNYKKQIVFTAAAAALLVVGATAAFAADAKVETNDDTPAQTTTDKFVSDSAVSSVTSEPAASEQNTPVENTMSETVISPVETFRIPVLDSYEERCFAYTETDENGNDFCHFIPFDRLNEPGYIYGCISHDDEYAVIGKFELPWDEIESYSDVFAKLPIEENVLRIYSSKEYNNLTEEYRLKFGLDYSADWGFQVAGIYRDKNNNKAIRAFPLVVVSSPSLVEKRENYTHEEHIPGVGYVRW